MEAIMDTPRTQSEPALSPVTGTVAAPRRTALSWLGRIVSWIVMALVTLIALALVAITVGPRFLPYQALVVRSGSMAPTIPTGSIVFYKKIAADKVKVGDIIVFNRPGVANEKITHRVYQVKTGPSGRYFITKGDANGTPDDWQVPAVGTGWIDTFHIPTIGYALVDLQSTIGRLLLLVIPALALGLITLYEIWRDRGGGATA